MNANVRTTTRSSCPVGIVPGQGRDAEVAPHTAVDLFDRVVEVRRERARRRGFATPLLETLSRCTISAADVESFVATTLTQAVVDHERLEAEIQAATGCPDEPMNHFAYYLRGLTTGASLPAASLAGCLHVFGTVAERIFGVTVDCVGTGPAALALAVRAGGWLAGTVRIDLLGPEPGQGDTVHSGPAADGGLPPPIGRALCRYQLHEGERMLTFDSAHSLFHEFGHALGHVLVRSRRPGPSGLEYLPVERLEDLSLWFEKWVYHADFAARVAPSAELDRGLRLCQRVKMLEFLGTQLQRAVVAALDFDVHRRDSGGFRESFQRLDDAFGISRYCDLGEILWTFAWPMYRSNPGLGVVYPWGGAFGAERFLPFLDMRLAGLPAPETFTATFRSCLDPDLPSVRPDTEAVSRFYHRAFTQTAVG